MSQFISLQEAVDMTALYRNQKEDILKTDYQNENILCISETFDREEIDTVLAREGCARLRIYYGMTEDFKIHAIIVGVNEENEDILPPSEPALTEATDDYIIDRGIRCPDLCPTTSPLNT